MRKKKIDPALKCEAPYCSSDFTIFKECTLTKWKILVGTLLNYLCVSTLFCKILCDWAWGYVGGLSYDNIFILRAIVYATTKLRRSADQIDRRRMGELGPRDRNAECTASDTALWVGNSGQLFCQLDNSLYSQLCSCFSVNVRFDVRKVIARRTHTQPTPACSAISTIPARSRWRRKSSDVW